MSLRDLTIYQQHREQEMMKAGQTRNEVPDLSHGRSKT